MGSQLTPLFCNAFTEGLQTNRPPQDIPDGAGAFMRNVDIGRSFDGVLAKRRGQITKVPALVSPSGTPRVTGLWEFVRFEQGLGTGSGAMGSGPTPDVITDFLYASSDRDVYEINLSLGSPWVSRYHNNAMQGKDVNFTTFNNEIFMVNENTSTQVGQGNAPFTTALGTPPANAKFITSWMGRVWIANDGSGRSRIHWSAINNGQDYVSVGDAGFIDVNPDDGQEITAIIGSGDYMYIFKRHSVHVISGYTPSNFVLHKVPNVDGAIYNRAVVDHGGAILYLSDMGVRSIANGGYSSGEISPLIRYDIENIPEAAKLHACVGINKFKQLWVCYDSNGDGQNDSAFVLNFLPQIQGWTHYDNINISVFLTMDNTDFIGGADDNVSIRTMERGDSDEGAVIPFEYRSKEHMWSTPYDYKKLQDFGIHMKVLAGKTLTVTVLVDGIDSGDTIVLPLDQTLVGTQTKILKLMKALGSQQGRTIQLVFKNTEANAPVEIYSYSMLAELVERQYSD
jgi:hypothetical protein